MHRLQATNKSIPISPVFYFCVGRPDRQPTICLERRSARRKGSGILCLLHCSTTSSAVSKLNLCPASIWAQQGACQAWCVRPGRNLHPCLCVFTHIEVGVERMDVLAIHCQHVILLLSVSSTLYNVHAPCSACLASVLNIQILLLFCDLMDQWLVAKKLSHLHRPQTLRTYRHVDWLLGGARRTQRGAEQLTTLRAPQSAQPMAGPQHAHAQLCTGQHMANRGPRLS